MPKRQLLRWQFTKGFWPNQGLLPGIEGAAVGGRNCWYRGAGRWESSKGVATAGTNGGVRHLLNVNNTHGGLTIDGSIVRYFQSYVWAGSGSAYVGGVLQGGTGSTLIIKPDSGAARPVGLAAPTAPTISVSPVAGLREGTASLRLTAVDDIGEESNASPPSNIISLSLDKVRFTTPALPPNATKFGVYWPRTGFGQEGPWFRDIQTGDIVPGTYDIDWRDGQLGILTPIENYQPPACTFAGALNNMLLAIGAYGNMIAPSIPGEFGAFPPDWPVALPGTGSPTAVKGTGLDESLLVASSSALCGVRASGATDVTPIGVWVIWPTTGFANSSAFCTYRDWVIGFTGQRGPIISTWAAENAAMNEVFAQPVMSEFVRLGFTESNTAVGYDPRNKCVAFISGTTAFCYGLDTEEWSLPMELPATIVTCATVGGSLLLGTAAGQMYILDSGSGMAYELIPYWQDMGAPEFVGTVRKVAVATSNGCNIDILTNLNDVTARVTVTGAANHSGWKRAMVRAAASVTAELSGTGAGHIIRDMAMIVIPHRISLNQAAA